MKKKYIRMTICITPELETSIKERAAAAGVNVSEFCRAALDPNAQKATSSPAPQITTNAASERTAAALEAMAQEFAKLKDAIDASAGNVESIKGDAQNIAKLIKWHILFDRHFWTSVNGGVDDYTQEGLTGLTEDVRNGKDENPFYR